MAEEYSSRDYMGGKSKMDTAYMGMISEDRSQTANLPKDVMMKKYPRCEYLDSTELDDTIRGIDDTKNEDVRKADRYQSDSKW